MKCLEIKIVRGKLIITTQKSYLFGLIKVKNEYGSYFHNSTRWWTEPEGKLASSQMHDILNDWADNIYRLRTTGK